MMIHRRVKNESSVLRRNMKEEARVSPSFLLIATFT